MSNALRFLADESCDFAVVRALRRAGHDVFAVAEVMRRSVDRELIILAREQKRIPLTEDKDFGQLGFAGVVESPGVILIRYPGNARQTMVDSVLELARNHAEKLHESFVVVQPGQIRITRSHKPSGNGP
jgi:predicted nuclease of predicted toxin-antitoxin system